MDETLGEFWVGSPFDFETIHKDENLSMYERNRLFLNHGQGEFIDASHGSGIDLIADSRAVAVGDLDEDGRPDIVVRSAGGGPLRVFLNRGRSGKSLHVSLRGTHSNSDGIGARMVLEVGQRRLHRDHFPQNSLYAQNANETIFGLGNDPGSLRLTVTWPLGTVQVLDDLGPGRIRIEEPGSPTGNDPLKPKKE